MCQSRLRLVCHDLLWWGRPHHKLYILVILYIVKMRILKTVKEYGSITVSTSSQTLETQTIKALGDIVHWGLQSSLTTVGGTGTELAAGGTPSGLFAGASIARLYKKISITDANNNDLCVLEKDDIWRQAYLVSLVNSDEFIFNKGLNDAPTVVTGDVTAQVDNVIVPQPISVADLPASVEIEIGVLNDFFSTVGTATATIVELTLYVRYLPPSERSITLRIKAFNVQAFSADTEISHLLPDGIKIHKLAYSPGNTNASSAGAELDNTRVDRLTLRRGSNEEIENQRRNMMDDYIDKVYDGTRLSGITILPLDSFDKTDATIFNFDVNAQVAPRIFYIYQ